MHVAMENILGNFPCKRPSTKKVTTLFTTAAAKYNAHHTPSVCKVLSSSPFKLINT